MNQLNKIGIIGLLFIIATFSPSNIFSSQILSNASTIPIIKTWTQELFGYRYVPTSPVPEGGFPLSINLQEQEISLDCASNKPTVEIIAPTEYSGCYQNEDTLYQCGYVIQLMAKGEACNSYEWGPPEYFNDNTVLNPLVEPHLNSEAVYCVTVTDDLGCTNSDCIYLKDLDFTDPPISYCYSDLDTLAISTYNKDATILLGNKIQIGPIAPNFHIDSIEWTPKIGLDDPYSFNPIASPEVSTIYRFIGKTFCSEGEDKILTGQVTVFVNTKDSCEIVSTCTLKNVPCNDGNPKTINDSYDSDCQCIGKPFRYFAKLLLEGFYDSQTKKMRTDLNSKNLLPLSQPYNKAPWFYQGQETTDSIPDNIVDWVLLVSRDSRKNILAIKAGFVDEEGNLIGIDGQRGIEFEEAYDTYLSIHHRSHLAILSTNTYLGDTSNYIINPFYAAGEEALKLVDGKYMLYAGDYNSSGIINSLDFNLWSTQKSIGNKYLDIDGDGNGVVDSLDFNLWKINAAMLTQKNIWFNR